ncbi:MAG TPA: 2Fe-2S iron-sulfur cluster-binding protein [Acidimicrobiales bacterium]|nr:2Fe-2S iron-sulfur cluster-binding protein [Acidimicrobiales bacterium]
MAPDGRPPLQLDVDGRQTEVPDRGQSLLEVLREDLGLTSAKDGCSPQGQCGCCTVLVDGQPRVACVTPARRVAGRSITTVDGLDPAVRDGWARAVVDAGASQCGFCTPGIICRLEGLRAKAPDAGHDAVEQALLAHLCRCTGWRTLLDAWDRFAPEPPSADERDHEAAAQRAEIEGGAHQRVDAEVALGRGGFADDMAPAAALVAVPDGQGGWAVGETLAEARAAAGKVQGRRTTVEARPPLGAPPGAWAAVLRTSWVEPAYLEPDAAWCEPGGEPASPLANGGAFGGKRHSPGPAAARQLADRYGRAVRVLLNREDIVRLGPKRPPVAGGADPDGTGVLRVIRTAGIEELIHRVAPGLRVEEVDVAGPPTSVDLRAAGWAEAMVLLAGARGSLEPVTDPIRGARAEAEIAADGTVRVRVEAGEVLDEVVLRSYCTGAAHMALSWVSSEGIAVDDDGQVHDLTIRSFGVLRAVDTPPIEVEVVAGTGPAVRGSDAVFAAVAAAAWLHGGCIPDWPTGQRWR